MPLDCIIRGGTVAAADGTRKTDVGIKVGLIASLGDDLGPAAETMAIIIAVQIAMTVHVFRSFRPCASPRKICEWRKSSIEWECMC